MRYASHSFQISMVYELSLVQHSAMPLCSLIFMVRQVSAHSQSRAWHSLSTVSKGYKQGSFHSAGLSPTALLMSEASTSANSLFAVNCPAFLIYRCRVPSCRLADRRGSAMSSATDTSHRIPCTCGQPVQSAPGETWRPPQPLARAAPSWSQDLHFHAKMPLHNAAQPCCSTCLSHSPPIV